MPRLLQQLRNDPLSSRIEAANEICELLEKISISSTTEIWYLVKDLCTKGRPSSARRSGLKVMIECIKKHSNSTADKVIYYKEITDLCSMDKGRLDPEFDLFLEALIQLTDNGKDLHDLNIYNLDMPWRVFVYKSFDLAGETAHLSDKTDGVHTQERRNFIKLIEYLNNCFKYNFVLVNEEFVLRVLSTSITTCLATENSALLLDLSLLVKTIVIFGYIPPSGQLITVRLLCWISYHSPKLREIAWESLLKVFIERPSEILSDVTSFLQDPILQEAQAQSLNEQDLRSLPKLTQRTLVTALGAIGCLEHLLLNITLCDASLRTVLPLKTIYNNITTPSVSESTVLNAGVLRLFDRLFSSYATESTPGSNLFQMMFPFHLWCVTSGNLLDFLLRLKINSVQEQDYWNSICVSLRAKYEANEISVTKDRLITFLLRDSDRLTEDLALFVLNHFQETKACVCLSTNWKENCRIIVNSFYYSESASKFSPPTRILSLKVLLEAFDYSVAYYDEYGIARDFIMDVLRNVKSEVDPEVIDYVYHTLLFGLIINASLSFLQELMDVFEPVLIQKRNKLGLKSIVSLGSFPSSAPRRIKSTKSERDSEINTLAFKDSYQVELAKVLSKSLLTLATHKAEEAGIVFEFVICLCNSALSEEDFEMALVLVRALIRMRCTVEGYVYFCQPIDMEGLATTMNRNSLIDSYKPLPSHLWCYPEEKDYLPSSTYDKPNRKLRIFEPSSNTLSIQRKGSGVIDVNKWFSLVKKITEEYYHWELYSYVWAHFCSQLCNTTLFKCDSSFITEFRRIVCDQLSLNLPATLTFPLVDTNVTKADLLVAFIRTLSSLVGYHDLFNKIEEDQIISSLLSSLASWEKTAIPSIHMLTICCYELPQSMKKYLIPILTRLQASITSAFASSHTLEFLMALIQVPTLTSNFTIEEFKRVFAIAFRYIEHARDMQKRNGNSSDKPDASRLQDHGVDAEVDNKVSTQWNKVTPMLHQYLLTTSFEVLSQWFLKMKLEDRSQVSSFIMKNIVSCCGATEFKDLDDVTIAHLDFLARFTYSNMPLRINNARKSDVLSNFSSNKWIIGQAIVAIDVDMNNGNSNITLRRPTGFVSFNLRLNNDMVPVDVNAEKDRPFFTSNYLLLQLFKPLDQVSPSKPLPLLDDSTTERALNTFDRVPVVAHHKAGIVYIGPGQKEESEILANTVGSVDYQQFLERVGHMIKLSEADSVYVGGLDKEGGTDGEFAYVWSDELTQLIFHTTTLMPTTLNDKYCLLKKRHIGNNHVNVFFDESGHPFNFNVIKSQFNFINIVISPHTRRYGVAGWNSYKYYKVKTYRRSEVPGIFSTSHYKLISVEQLPHFIRNSVLMANRLARIWHESNDGVYVTNWEMRVRQLRSLRERTIAAHEALHEEQQKHYEEQGFTKNMGGPTDMASATTIQSFLEQLQAPSSTLTNNALQIARYERPSPSDTELHTLLEYNSYTF